MLRTTLASSRALRVCALGLVTFTTAILISSESAEARRYRHRHHVRHHHVARESYSPQFSSIIVDGNSGAVLSSNNPDAIRRPASLTKIMTLYLLFERLDAGKMKLDTEMDVSEHASVQAPTKLGLRPGQTLKVEDAIKGLVTRSANDAAVVIAEAIAGDEDYFATSVFNYHGRSIRNHNHLLGSVEGVDGIKTGYTRASGFNLVTSMRRGNRHIVGVVLGGASAGARDARMRTLVEQHVQMAATTRTTTRFAEAEAGESRQPQRTAAASATASRSVEVLPAAEPKTQRYALASASPNARPEPVASSALSFAAPSTGSTEPIKPVLVKTVTVKAAGLQPTSASPTRSDAALSPPARVEAPVPNRVEAP